MRGLTNDVEPGFVAPGKNPFTDIITKLKPTIEVPKDTKLFPQFPSVEKVSICITSMATDISR
jgi:hypothetical protein